MKKIIVLGSLNMDLTIESDRIPAKGETIHGSDFLMNSGGKGGNQAVAAARSGSYVAFLGAVGDDVFGFKLEKTLEETGVDITRLQKKKETPTGVAFIIRSEGDNRIILNSGANFQVDIEKMGQQLRELATEGDFLVTQFENQEDAVWEALKVGSELKLYNILNPAPAKAFSTDLYSYIDCIIVNQSECETLTGIYPKKVEDCRRALEIFQERGTRHSIITLGSKGSVGFDGKNEIFVPAYQVKAVDTTAAGDTFIGAFASFLTEHGETEVSSILEDAMKYATKAAALAVMKKGAFSSIPFKKEIETMN